MTANANFDHGTVQHRKWSPTANDPKTGNDPQIGPQMIPNRKWSPMWTANDPSGKRGMAWSLFLRSRFSPVPELYFLPTPYRGWTRAGERRVQDNLHAHAQNEPIKNYQVPTTLLASMCRAMPFSARALKENIFFDVDIVIKNKHKNVKIEIWFIVVCTLIDNEDASLLFSQTFFAYCFCMLSDHGFCKSFWKENLTRASSSFA